MSLPEPTTLDLQFQLLGVTALIDGVLQLLIAKETIDNREVVSMLQRLHRVMTRDLAGRLDEKGINAILEPIRHMVGKYEERVAAASAAGIVKN